MASQLIPGRTAATAAACANRSTSNSSRTAVDGSPREYMRVESLQYPSGIVPPMSITTESPTASTRSESS